MTTRISKLFGLDIYSTNAEYKGKLFDLVINLEKGRIETITTEPLKFRSKQEAKRVITEKSIPYRNVRSMKDILLVGNTPSRPEEEEEEAPAAPPTPSYRSRLRR